MTWAARSAPQAWRLRAHSPLTRFAIPASIYHQQWCRARQTFTEECPEHAMSVEEADIRTLEYAPSGMIILNFTLQFLPPADRDALLRRLFDALEPGGVLVLSEKTVDVDERDNAWRVERDPRLQTRNGYSDMGKSAKSAPHLKTCWCPIRWMRCISAYSRQASHVR